MAVALEANPRFDSKAIRMKIRMNCMDCISED